MKSKLFLLGLFLALVLAVAACTSAAPETTMEDTTTSEAMTKAEGGAEAMTEGTSDDMMIEEGSDAMTESSDDMMNEESSDEMSKNEEGSDSMTEGSSDEMMAEEGSEEMMKGKDGSEMMGQSELQLTFTGLPSLGEDFVYEGWLIVEGNPVSTGVFVVDDQGMVNPHAFSVEPDTLRKAGAFVLTIEPSADADPAPSPIHVLAGDFDGDAAALGVGHPAALGNDFAEASGTFLLGIPSSNSASDSYRSGIWFTGLNLPALPEGWVYEGWVVGPEGPMSTGRFSHGREADSDGAGPTSGPNPGPAFPGQDYINPPLDLTQGFVAVISIEPDPDNSPAPFALKPLVAPIEDAGDHVNQTMENQAASFASGLASRQIEQEAMAEEMAMSGPDWFFADLTNVNTNQTFRLADFHGQVVLVETMAVWCPKCLSQQQEVAKLHDLLGQRDDFVTVVLDIDPNEDAATLQSYTARHGFDWYYAVASREVAREIGELYGSQFLNPPSTPMLIIDRNGEVHPLPFGQKSAEVLLDALQAFLNAGM